MHRTGGPRLLLETAGQVLLMIALLVAYRYGRHLADGDPAAAFTNARQVWEAERALRLPDESVLQAAALRWDGWVTFANHYYLAAHFPLTGLFLLWVWSRHRAAWSRVRAATVLSGAAALLVHALYPLAPPRFHPGWGLVDLMVVYGPSAYAERPGEGLANQFAAMPSLHVGWALLVAWGVIRYGRGRWRWIAAGHPLVTTLVVVLTANHYWLDGVIGGLLVIAAIRVTARLDVLDLAAPPVPPPVRAADLLVGLPSSPLRGASAARDSLEG